MTTLLFPLGHISFTATVEMGSCSSGGVWHIAKRRKWTCVGAPTVETGSCSSTVYCLAPSSTGYCSSTVDLLQPPPATVHPRLLFIQPPSATVHPASMGSCSSTPNRLGCAASSGSRSSSGNGLLPRGPVHSTP